MRRLIPMLAAGLLAGGTVLSSGMASASTIAVHRQASCTNIGAYYFNVAKSGVNYYLGTPNNVSSGADAILKPKENSTTQWTLCELGSSPVVLVQNRGFALTSRASGPSADVTVETTGNSGNGFSSQQWTIAAGSGSTTITFQNVKTGLFLRVRNSGPSMGQTVTTGNSPASWTYSS